MIDIVIDRARDAARSEVERYRAPGLLPFLIQTFGQGFPSGARILHGRDRVDVTPRDGGAIQSLQCLPGPFVIELLPASGFELQIFMIFASFVVQGILAPAVPTAVERNVQTESPNNGLSDRSNKARVNGRIPDIYGTVRSTPDLLQVPYKVFQDHVEKEISYMCIGRGSYEVPSVWVRDDTTPCEEIAGTSVEVYAPFTSPNSGDSPQLRIGNAINTPILKTARLQSVNGQVLQPADSGGSYRNAVVFTSPNVITSYDSSIDYTAMFVPGDSITITEGAQTAGTFSYHSDTVEAKADGTAGVLTVEGVDITGDWSPGQIMTVSASRVGYTFPAGDGVGTAFENINGIYTITSVEFSTDPENPSDPGRTAFVLQDAATLNPTWAAATAGFEGVGVGVATMSRPSGVVQFDLSGTYTINTLNSSQITLNAPAVVNPDWTVMADDYGGTSRTLTPNLFTSGDRWIGEFTLASNEPITRLISNFVALQGLYADNGTQQYKQDISVRLEATPVDSLGAPTGSPEVFDGVVSGSAVTRSTRALTMYADLSATSNCWKVRARRLTPKNLGFVGTVVDEIKWRDVYGAATVAQAHFGNITTVQSVTFATDGALNIKDRKLNMLVTRKLPQRISGSDFTPELYPTNDVADILSAICLDPRIGNRTAAEVDFDNLCQVSQEIKDYFGFDGASEFSYTIDNDNLSFEETVAAIASAVFCTAYRRGSVIRLNFERENEDSVILFNHRNKAPGTDARAVQFGNSQSNDGVEYQYVSPIDDALVVYYLPEDRSAVNPKKIESIGVRRDDQAYLQAWRAWNRIRYMHTTAKFDALPEANLLVLNDRILVADNTRADSQDGEIRSVSGLNITLSQPIDWAAGVDYTIYLQNSDGQVEAIGLTPGTTPHTAALAVEPRTPIETDSAAYVRTTYIITSSVNARQAQPFLVTEKSEPNDNTTIPLTAINYDARYYQNDGEYRI